MSSLAYKRRLLCLGETSPVILPFASIGGCQLIKMARGRPSRLITVKSLGAELGAEKGRRKKESVSAQRSVQPLLWSVLFPGLHDWQEVMWFGFLLSGDIFSCSVSCWIYTSHLPITSMYVSNICMSVWERSPLFYFSWGFFQSFLRFVLIWIKGLRAAGVIAVWFIDKVGWS